jgi:hypothetical protein
MRFSEVDATSNAALAGKVVLVHKSGSSQFALLNVDDLFPFITTFFV